MTEAMKTSGANLTKTNSNPCNIVPATANSGFKREGVLRDAIMDGANYADDILMSILEDEWRTLKTQR